MREMAITLVLANTAHNQRRSFRPARRFASLAAALAVLLLLAPPAFADGTTNAPQASIAQVAFSTNTPAAQTSTNTSARKAFEKQPEKKRASIRINGDEADAVLRVSDAYDGFDADTLIRFFKIGFVGIFGFFFVCGLTWAWIRFDFPQLIVRRSTGSKAVQESKDYYWDRPESPDQTAGKGARFTLRNTPVVLWKAVKRLGLDVVAVFAIAGAMYAVNLYHLIAVWTGLSYILLKVSFLFILEAVAFRKDVRRSRALSELSVAQKIKFLEGMGKKPEEIRQILGEQDRGAAKAKGPVI